MRHLRLAIRLALVVGPAACLSSTGPGVGGSIEPDPSATTRIFFIGNSLTYANDLPGMVKALADSAGIAQVQSVAVAKPDYALEDHWADGEARGVVEKGGWTWVVLQQGPSSRPENRANLREWAATFATVIRAHGGTPALYQVWPATANFADFDAANESYRLAALDVNGALLPAGQAWQAAWRRDASIELYAADGLHPSIEGSYLAALTIAGRLFNRSVIGMPPGLSVSAGTFHLAPARALTLQEAADEANGR